MSAAPAGRWRLPWRSAAAGWVAFGVVAVVGVPLFLRMPLWIDVTLYDVAARTMLSGGTHYRDVFDTNPPGFVWLLCGVRTLLGASIEAVRAVDLLVVSAIGLLLLRKARAGGATSASVAWGATGMTGFYLFVSEFNHAQRDTWMMLPALLAAGYRASRVRAAQTRTLTDGWVFRTAVVEGLVWGAAVWIKPHVFPVAIAVWAAVQTDLGASVPAGQRLRRATADVLGALTGGLTAGAAGITWLVATGTWPYFVDVFTNWNSAYVGQTFMEFGERYQCQLGYFPPWSLFAGLAVPVALANVIDARPWRIPGSVFEPGPVARRIPRWLYTAPATAEERSARVLLAVLYLSWLSTALFLQKQFHYVHVPETLLMIAVLAANRWAASVLALAMQAGVIAWLALIPVAGWKPAPQWFWEDVYFRHLVWTYSDRSPDRLRWWRACLDPRVSGEVRNGVAFQSDYFSGTDLAELEEIAGYLRAQGVKDGELIAYNDSPHVLYLMLDIKPGLRFMHLSTAPAIGEKQYWWVTEEVQAAAKRTSPKVRFVVSDLKRLSVYEPPPNQWQYVEPGPNDHDHLPPVVDEELRALFPLNQPTVFRSGNGRGRYIVHVLTVTDFEYIMTPW